MTTRLPRTIHCVALVVLVAASASSAAATREQGTPRCVPGMHPVTVGGRHGLGFCGPASAVVHLGSRTLQYHGGLCRQAAGSFSVNIGTIVPGLITGKPASFGLTTHGTQAGRQLNAAVGFTFEGRSYALAEQLVTLRSGLRGGSFAGRVLGSTKRVIGTFTC